MDLQEISTIVLSIDIEKPCKCIVHLLDKDSSIECEHKPSENGTYILESIAEHLGIMEIDYFGLYFYDIFEKKTWLVMYEPIYKQVLLNSHEVEFWFGVKFYPLEPHFLDDKATRRQIFLQVKQDLLDGRLYCTTEEGTFLMALMLQHHYGDYDPEFHTSGYENLSLVFDQNGEMQTKAAEIHSKFLSGKTETEIEYILIRIASKLETYGMDPQLVEYEDGKQLYLGVNFRGISTFRACDRIHHIPWIAIDKIDLENKSFIIILKTGTKETFICISPDNCARLFGLVMDHLVFKTLKNITELSVVSKNRLTYKLPKNSKSMILSSCRFNYGENPSQVLWRSCPKKDLLFLKNYVKKRRCLKNKPNKNGKNLIRQSLLFFIFCMIAFFLIVKTNILRNAKDVVRILMAKNKIVFTQE